MEPGHETEEPERQGFWRRNWIAVLLLTFNGFLSAVYLERTYPTAGFSLIVEIKAGNILITQWWTHVENAGLTTPSSAPAEQFAAAHG